MNTYIMVTGIDFRFLQETTLAIKVGYRYRAMAASLSTPPARWANVATIFTYMPPTARTDMNLLLRNCTTF